MTITQHRILIEIVNFEQCYGTRPTATELKNRLHLNQDILKQALAELFSAGSLWQYDKNSRAYRMREDIAMSIQFMDTYGLNLEEYIELSKAIHKKCEERNKATLDIWYKAEFMLKEDKHYRQVIIELGDDL